VAPPVVKKIAVRGLLGLLGAVVVAYIADSVALRVRLSMGGPGKAYDTVTVLYGAGLKNGKLDLYTDQPMEETCSRSLFPQLGYEPCWYLRKHATEMIN
jgi:hypothetical protein